MYGLVNKALQGLVTSEKGTSAWEAVRARTTAPASFVSMEAYPDSVTYDLVAAASEVLEEDAGELLKRLGRYWVTYTASEGYGSMLDMWGADMRTFLENLDLMHARVKSTMSELAPPVFAVAEEPDGRLRLTYNTHRDGLAPMVVGLLEGLADRFGSHVTVEHVVSRADAGHDEFLLALSDA